MARRSYDDELSFLETNQGAGYRYDENGDYEAYDEFGRSKAQILAEYQDKANRLNAVSGVYQRADRIITGDSEITVTVVSDPEMKTNAMNNGREIIFNANLISDIDNDNIMHFHGLNYHEVAHVLFSPRGGSNLVQYVKDNKYRTAYYVLEEARAEALLISKFPATRLFLESATNEYLLSNVDKISDYFPIITGRTYLPLEIRQAVADKFIATYGLDVANKLHNLIHAYRTLVFPRDFDKAKGIIAQMAEIYGLDDEPTRTVPKPKGECGTPFKGRPEKGGEQERLQDRNDKADKNTPKETLDVGDKPTSGDNSTEYNGEDIKFGDDDKAIADLLNKRMQDIRDTDIVKREVNETRKAILNSDEVRGAVKPTDYYTYPVSEASNSIARRFGQELERIVRDNDPNWNKFNARGKLNITRTMNPDVNAIRTVFDQWDTGNPNTDIEAVILTDTSSSMGGLMRSVMENNWIIKRGIEGIEGSVTSISFNHESRLLYDKKEKAKANIYRHLHSSGSTNPIRGLIEAERILTMSKKSIKLAFIVTDGEWELTDECDSIIESMNDKGFITCVVFLGGYETYKHLLERALIAGDEGESARNYLKSIKHSAKIFQAVATPKDVLQVAQSLVKSMLNTNRAVA